MPGHGNELGAAITDSFYNWNLKIKEPVLPIIGFKVCDGFQIEQVVRETCKGTSAVRVQPTLELIPISAVHIGAEQHHTMIIQCVVVKQIL